MWGLRAIFLTDRDNTVNYTFYDEVKFKTEAEAIEAINSEYGDMLADAATIDCDIEDDLIGYYLEDLEPYKIEEEK